MKVTDQMANDGGFKINGRFGHLRAKGGGRKEENCRVCAAKRNAPVTGWSSKVRYASLHAPYLAGSIHFVYVLRFVG